MKTCTACGEEKEMTEYSPKSNSPDGKRARCKPCTSAENMARYARNREELQRIKMEKGCERCGFNSHPAALQFDHIDPTTKSFNIGASCSCKGLKTLLTEVAKCRILCANCHAIRTWHSEDF